MSKVRLNKSGFTLIELLVAISVTSIVFIGIMTFLVNSLAGNAAREAKADLLRESQLSLDVITKDARLSSGVLPENTVSDPNSPDAESTFGRGWVSTNNTLILARSAEDSNRNILFEDPIHYVTAKDNVVYFIKDGSLYKRTISADIANNSSKTSCPKEESDADCPADIRMVQNVESFSVRYFDGLDNEVEPEQARSIETSLTLKVNKFGREVKANYTTRTVFRNE